MRIHSLFITLSIVLTSSATLFGAPVFEVAVTDTTAQPNTTSFLEVTIEPLGGSQEVTSADIGLIVDSLNLDLAFTGNVLLPSNPLLPFVILNGLDGNIAIASIGLDLLDPSPSVLVTEKTVLLSFEYEVSDAVVGTIYPIIFDEQPFIGSELGLTGVGPLETTFVSGEIVVVPEPMSVALTAMGLALLLRRQHR